MAAKPQPWYAQFNQPPRSPKHGRNWKPTPAPHRHTSNGASDDTTVRTSLPKAAWRSLNAPAVDPSGAIDPSITYFQWATGFISVDPFAPPVIPYAGVIAGEITSHRMWYVLTDDSLCSVAHHFIWKPGAVIEGNLNEVVHRNFWSGKTIYGGVYSYANQDHIDREIAEYSVYGWPTLVQFGFDQPALTIFGIAIGTIKCWGEVIEHEKGYRAQYAKLTSIDSVIGAVNINELRQRYLP
jgi:hypothetical protein